MNIPPVKIHIPEDDRCEILDSIDSMLQSGQLTLGTYGKEFEDLFAEYIGSRYAISVNSGTSALEIALRCFNVKGGSVIVPTNTFIATPLSVLHARGNIKFVDVLDDMCIDIEQVNESICKDTKGVIVVHIGGIVSKHINELLEICHDHNIFLLEDAAHAHGSTYKGQCAGSFGDAGAFSFYPTKIITSGEGGMITTDDKMIHERSLVFRDQGKAGFYNNIHTEQGYNWRMSEVHAVIGLTQFKRLNEFIEHRRKIAAIYDDELRAISGIDPISMPKEMRSNYYKYIAMLHPDINREKLKSDLKEQGVHLSGEVYELPCHLQPVFKHYGYKEGDFPNAERLSRSHICLPIYSNMLPDEAKYVTDILSEVV